MVPRKLKGLVLSICLVFLIFNSVPPCYGTETSIWGVSENSSMSFTYKVEYEGSISAVTDVRDYHFTVLNIWDNDGNNFTELLYFRQRMKDGTPTLDSYVLDDSSSKWNWDDFLSPIVAEEIYPIIPISFNSTYNVGLNWSTELYTINSTFTNYSVGISFNQVEIFQWSSGVDGDTGAVFLINKTIIWDYSTGWLISYELAVDYKDPLNYILRISVDQKVPSGSFIIDIPLLIGIIGIIIGTIGILLGIYILKKFRTYALDDYPEHQEPSKPVLFTTPGKIDKSEIDSQGHEK